MGEIMLDADPKYCFIPADESSAFFSDEILNAAPLILRRARPALKLSTSTLNSQFYLGMDAHPPHHRPPRLN